MASYTVSFRRLSSVVKIFWACKCVLGRKFSPFYLRGTACLVRLSSVFLSSPLWLMTCARYSCAICCPLWKYRFTCCLEPSFIEDMSPCSAVSCDMFNELSSVLIVSYQERGSILGSLTREFSGRNLQEQQLWAPEMVLFSCPIASTQAVRITDGPGTEGPPGAFLNLILE